MRNITSFRLFEVLRLNLCGVNVGAKVIYTPDYFLLSFSKQPPKQEILSMYTAELRGIYILSN